MCTFRHGKYARVYSHTTTAIHGIGATLAPLREYLAAWCVCRCRHTFGAMYPYIQRTWYIKKQISHFTWLPGIWTWGRATVVAQQKVSYLLTWGDQYLIRTMTSKVFGRFTWQSVYRFPRTIALVKLRRQPVVPYLRSSTGHKHHIVQHVQPLLVPWDKSVTPI